MSEIDSKLKELLNFNGDEAQLVLPKCRFSKLCRRRACRGSVKAQKKVYSKIVFFFDKKLLIHLESILNECIKRTNK